MQLSKNNRKNTDAYTLVKELRKDNVFHKFDGFGVTPRDEASNIYIFWRDEAPRIEYWINYDPKGYKYFKIDEDQLEKNLSIIKQTDSINYNILNQEYLSKAYELISIMKKLNIEKVNASFGKFYCSFNDSSRLMYLENSNTLDSTFYRTYKDYKWIDKNFLLYY